MKTSIVTATKTNHKSVCLTVEKGVDTFHAIVPSSLACFKFTSLCHPVTSHSPTVQWSEVEDTAAHSDKNTSAYTPHRGNEFKNIKS